VLLRDIGLAPELLPLMAEPTRSALQVNRICGLAGMLATLGEQVEDFLTSRAAGA
jgi:hypothetical protein